MVVCPPIQMCTPTVPVMGPPPPPIYATPTGTSPVGEPPFECYYTDGGPVKIDPQIDMLQRSIVNLEIVNHSAIQHHGAIPSSHRSTVVPAGTATSNVRAFMWSPTALTAPPSPPTYPSMGSPTVAPFSFPSNWGQSYGMELVWHGEFINLFQRYSPNIWFLMPTNSKPTGGRWNYFMDSAKVRFCCEDCGHGWTSMKGRVVFWYTFDRNIGEGIVTFKLYGQKCQKCNSSTFESSMWYPEEVAKVLANIYNKVGQIYYGFYQPPIHKARRPGKPRNPHNQDLCQACQDGVCSEKRP